MNDYQSGSGGKGIRVAAAAANIARGAAYGGVYGAAAEAAKSFLPELIKLGVVLLFVVVLFPLFAFVSLPQYSVRLQQLDRSGNHRIYRLCSRTDPNL